METEFSVAGEKLDTKQGLVEEGTTRGTTALVY
jgi:hypothetical protein